MQSLEGNFLDHLTIIQFRKAHSKPAARTNPIQTSKEIDELFILTQKQNKEITVLAYPATSESKAASHKKY